MVQLATIVTIIRASRAFTSSKRASSSSGETKTGTQITLERFNSPSAIYLHDLEKDERQVAEWYNTLSDSYDELYGEEQSRKYETVLGFLGTRHFEGLIDIGCWAGNLLQKAREIYNNAAGIALSAKMLRFSISRKTDNNNDAQSNSSSHP